MSQPTGVLPFEIRVAPTTNHKSVYSNFAKLSRYQREVFMDFVQINVHQIAELVREFEGKDIPEDRLRLDGNLAITVVMNADAFADFHSRVDYIYRGLVEAGIIEESEPIGDGEE